MPRKLKARKNPIGICETCPGEVPAFHRSKEFYGEWHFYCEACFKAICYIKNTRGAKPFRKTPYPGGRQAFFAKNKRREALIKLTQKLEPMADPNQFLKPRGKFFK